MPLLPHRLLLPTGTVSARGAVQGLLAECARFGARGVLVHGASAAASGLLARLRAQASPGLAVATWQHPGGEPQLAHVARLRTVAREHAAQWVAAVGGGSVLDVAKAAAGLYACAGEPVHYHAGAEVERDGLPFIAVPTTAGSGAEATPNAVLTNAVTGQKKSIRADAFVARRVVLDADLLRSCSRATIACSGMDAYTQAVEAYTSRHATWLSDQLALKALALIAANLPRVYASAEHAAEEELLAASYLTGVAFTMSRLGLVHGLAHPLGSRYGVRHGLVCAVCLPHVLELNRPALGPKYAALSAAVGGDLLDHTRGLLRQLNLHSPFRKLEPEAVAGIVRETLASGSTAANPKPVTAADVEGVLHRLFVGPAG